MATSGFSRSGQPRTHGMRWDHLAHNQTVATRIQSEMEEGRIRNLGAETCRCGRPALHMDRSRITKGVMVGWCKACGRPEEVIHGEHR